MLRYIENPLEIISYPSLRNEFGIGVYFTCRNGGLSSGFQKSLNLSYNVADDRDSVAANRKILAEAINVDTRRWTMCRQVHGCRVKEIMEYDIGRGAFDHESGIPRTDALISRQPGTVVGVLTADCVPVIIAEKRKRICAAVHAGWRGVIAGVLPKVCNMISGQVEGEKADIEVYIGPHIRSCCFEVQEDIGTLFENIIGGDVVERSAGNGIHVDLEKSLVSQLKESGIDTDSIHTVERCTSCDEDFFSHRRDAGLTGRQAGIAVIY